MNKVIYFQNGKRKEFYFAYCFEMPETGKMLFRIGNERLIIDKSDLIKSMWYDYETRRI